LQELQGGLVTTIANDNEKLDIGTVWRWKKQDIIVTYKKCRIQH